MFCDICYKSPVAFTHDVNSCPNIICKLCNVKGHIAPVCPQFSGKVGSEKREANFPSSTLKRTKLDDTTPAVTKPVAVVSPTIAVVETVCKTSNIKEIHYVSSSQTVVAPVKESLKSKPDKSYTSSCTDSDHSHTIEEKKQETLQFFPSKSDSIRMEARLLVPFKTTSKDIKDITFAEIIKDQELGVGLLVKKQICKVKTDSICVYVNNDTTNHVILRSTAALEVAVNSLVPQAVNVQKKESKPSSKQKLVGPSAITPQVPPTKNIAQSHTIAVKEEETLTLTPDIRFIRMEACTLVQFKTTNKDMKGVVSAEIIKEQEVGVGLIVKKQICKVKTDSIAVYVYNDTTKHSRLKSTVSLEVSINSTVQQVVNVPKDESMLSLKPKLETSVLTSKEPTTKNTSYDTIQAKSNSLEVKEEKTLKFSPASTATTRMEARSLLLVPFKNVGLDMKEVASAEIIKDQELGVGLLVKKQKCKVKTDSISVYVHNNTTKLSNLESTAALEVVIKSLLPQAVNGKVETSRKSAQKAIGSNSSSALNKPLTVENKETLKFTPASPAHIRMEARILVPFKPANKDMKEVTSAEIIKDQALGSGLIVKKQICKVKTDSISVYVNNDTTSHSFLKNTVTLEVLINGPSPHAVNIPEEDSKTNQTCNLAPAVSEVIKKDYLSTGSKSIPDQPFSAESFKWKNGFIKEYVDSGDMGKIGVIQGDGAEDGIIFFSCHHVWENDKWLDSVSARKSLTAGTRVVFTAEKHTMDHKKNSYNIQQSFIVCKHEINLEKAKTIVRQSSYLSSVVGSRSTFIKLIQKEAFLKVEFLNKTGTVVKFISPDLGILHYKPNQTNLQVLFSLKQTYLNGELYSGDLAKYSSTACWVHQDIPPGTTVHFDARHSKGVSFQAIYVFVGARPNHVRPTYIPGGSGTVLDKRNPRLFLTPGEAKMADSKKTFYYFDLGLPECLAINLKRMKTLKGIGF